MKADYFDEMRFLRLIEQIRFYERADLLLKISVFTIVFSLLLSSGSFSPASSLLLILLFAKIFGWLFNKALKLVSNRWLPRLVHKVDLTQDCSGKLGRYKLSEIRYWIAEIRRDLAITFPLELELYEAKFANAFAGRGHRLEVRFQDRIALLTNLFHLLEPEELKAVIAHETGHHKHFPTVEFAVRLLIPVFTGRPSYRQCLEHLADWYAVKLCGVVPAANALIKLYQRQHLIGEILNGLAYLQEELKVGISELGEFLEAANASIPDSLKPTENLDKHMARIIESYLAKKGRTGVDLGKVYAEKYRKDSKLKLQRSLFRSRYKSINWQLFDNRIKDGRLDDCELEKLYLYLKEHAEAELFPDGEGRRREWRSHPPLRERLIFMVEAVNPAPHRKAAAIWCA